MTGLEFLVLLMIGGYAAKHAVADTASAVRGKTPPSHQRWHQRQQRKQRADAKPGYWRTVWQNATAEWSEKATHRHQARLEHIREREPQKTARWKEKKLARAQKWDTARAAAARRGGQAWQRTKDGTRARAGAAKSQWDERRTEKQAWKENTRRTGSDPTGDESASDQPELTDQQETLIQSWIGAISRKQPVTTSADTWWSLPAHARSRVMEQYLRKRDIDRPPVTIGDTTPEHLALADPDAFDAATARDPELIGMFHNFPPLEDDHGSEPESTHNNGPVAITVMGHQKDLSTARQQGIGDNGMSQPTHEVNNLGSAISFCENFESYFSGMVSQFDSTASQASQAARDLEQAPSIVETAMGQLAGQGLGQEVTGPMAQAKETAAASTNTLSDVGSNLASAKEQVAAAAAAFASAKSTLQKQAGLAEQVAAQKASGAGVAADTEFYANDA